MGIWLCAGKRLRALPPVRRWARWPCFYGAKSARWRKRLHTIERDRFPGAIALDAVSNKTFDFAGCTGPKEAFVFEAR
jgi:hypothetical protein